MDKLTKRVISLIQSQIIGELGYAPDTEVANPFVEEVVLDILAKLVASQIDVGYLASQIRSKDFDDVDEPDEPQGNRAGYGSDGIWKRNWKL